MRLIKFAVAFAVAGAFALVTVPADAQQPQQPKKKQRVYYNRDHTVFVSRDENGRTRTRIIIQRRSYLDPGTEPLPSERNTLDYVQTPGQRGDSVLNHTPFAAPEAMMGPFDLPSTRNPWLQF